MKFSVQAFTGVAPKYNARHLGEGGAQKALNVEAFGQTLKPLRGYSDPVTSVPSGSQTVYRYGQSETDEDKYWMAWPGDVDVCRSHIANDTTEWTFITDGEYPKATNNATLQDDIDPAVHEWVRLGLPAATPAATTIVTERGPMLSLGRETWSKFSTALGITLSSTGGVTFTTPVTLTDVSSAAAVATAINTAFSSTNHVLAITQGDLLRLFGSTGLRTSTLALGWTASTVNTLYGTVYASYTTYKDEQLKISSTVFSKWTTATVLSFTGGALENSVVTVTLPSVASYSVIGARIKSVLEAAGYTFGVNLTTYDFYLTSYSTEIRLNSRRAPTGKQLTLTWPSTQPTGLTATWAAEVPESRVYTWTLVSKIDNIEIESAAAPPSKVISLAPLTSWVDLTLPVAVSSEQIIRVTHKRIYRTAGLNYVFVAEIDGQETAFRDVLLAEDLGEILPEAATAAQPPDGLLGLTSLPNGLLAGFLNQDVYFSLPYRPYAWPAAYSMAVDTPVVGLGAIDTTLVVLTKSSPYFFQGTTPGSLVAVKADLDQACASKRSIVSMNGTVLYASPDGLISLSPAGSSVLTADRFSREDWQKLNPETIHAYGHDLRYIAFHDPDPDGATGFVYDLTSGEFIKHTLTAAAGYQDPRNDALYVAATGGSLMKWGEGNRLAGVWRSKKATLPHVTSFALAQVEAEAYAVCVIGGAIDPDYTTAGACVVAGHCTLGGSIDPTKTTSATCTSAGGTWTAYNGVWTVPILDVYMDGVQVHTQAVTSRDPFRLPAIPGRDLELELDNCSEVFAISLAQAAEELFDE